MIQLPRTVDAIGYICRIDNFHQYCGLKSKRDFHLETLKIFPLCNKISPVASSSGAASIYSKLFHSKLRKGQETEKAVKLPLL